MSVSVILLTYNCERFVAAAIQSILHQTILPDELIVADDGSTDSTFKYIERSLKGFVGCKDVKVVAFSNSQNIGTWENIRKALTFATGDFIVFAAGDDVSHLDRIARTIPALEKSCADAVSGCYDKIDANGEVLVHGFVPDYSRNFIWKYLKLSDYDSFVGGAASAYRATVINRIFNLLEKLPSNIKLLNDDIVITFGLIGLGSRIVQYNISPLIRYRVLDSSVANYRFAGKSFHDYRRHVERLRADTVSMYAVYLAMEILLSELPALQPIFNKAVFNEDFSALQPEFLAFGRSIHQKVQALFLAMKSGRPSIVRAVLLRLFGIQFFALILFLHSRKSLFRVKGGH